MTNYVSVSKTPHLFYRAVDVRKKNDAVEPLLWLWDTSIQGPQNLVPEKCSHTLCIFCLALLKGHLYSWGERNKVTMATAFKTRTVSLKSMHCTCGNSTHSIAEIR